MIGTRPQSGENKATASMALSAWEWKHTVGGGAEVSPGRKEQRAGSFWGEVGQRTQHPVLKGRTWAGKVLEATPRVFKDGRRVISGATLKT